MVFVDVDTWNSAKAVLESTETSTSPSGPELDGGGRMIPYNATHTLDNDDDLHIDLYCLNTYTHVSQAELFAYVSTIENQLRTQGGPGSYTWAIDNPADTSVTLWYNANIMIWDATVHAGMIWGMFKLGIMYKMCNDDRGLARGALVTATHTQIQREVVYVEAYATKWIPRYWP
ncbi:hypothetical protein J1614_000701 [Plenodomus biglobosus]|nr:hypothetical protein J1614_000701 [Plenodomus biglobosus]